MNPVQKLWMFYNWIEDQNDDVELVKNHAYLLGSFWNPEAVQKLTGHGGQVHVSTDEEFEASTRIIEQEKEREKSIVKRKKKRKIKG